MTGVQTCALPISSLTVAVAAIVTGVQAAWEEIIATRDRFTLRAAPDQGQLFTPLLEYAEKLYDGAALEPGTAHTLARETVGSYLAGSRGE